MRLSSAQFKYNLKLKSIICNLIWMDYVAFDILNVILI